MELWYVPLATRPKVRCRVVSNLFLSPKRQQQWDGGRRSVVVVRVPRSSWSRSQRYLSRVTSDHKVRPGIAHR